MILIEFGTMATSCPFRGAVSTVGASQHGPQEVTARPPRYTAGTDTDQQGRHGVSQAAGECDSTEVPHQVPEYRDSGITGPLVGGRRALCPREWRRPWPTPGRASQRGLPGPDRCRTRSPDSGPTIREWLHRNRSMSVLCPKGVQLLKLAMDAVDPLLADRLCRHKEMRRVLSVRESGPHRPDHLESGGPSPAVHAMPSGSIGPTRPLLRQVPSPPPWSATR